MPDRIEYPRIQRAISIAAGVALIGAGFVLGALIRMPGSPEVPGVALVLAGSVLLGLGIALRQSRFSAAVARVSLAVLTILLVIGLAEAIFRIVGYDFNSPSAEIPIFNQSPNFHMGGGILRRPGPASWQGKPLCSLIHFCWGNENAYPDEKPIVVRYDRLGFRNPADLTDWEVAVTGDSFVEAGYLPYEKIFTTLAAERLGIRIKNLGVSGTGPIFQTAYVRNYGKAPSTRHAVLCFFDGNDVFDLAHEVQQTNYVLHTGHPLGRPKQPSLLGTVQDRLGHMRHRATRDEAGKLQPNAFLVAGNREYPAAMWPIPPLRWEDLKNDRRELVAATMTNWGATLRSRGMEPWVMCIPDSRRVIQSYLRYADTNSLMARWQPGLFGPHLATICTNLDIRFIDTFPALRREVEEGRVPYNLFGDVHLNAQGSQVVAAVLAEALSADVRKRK